jgi:hypothetical protein
VWPTTAKRRVPRLFANPPIPWEALLLEAIALVAPRRLSAFASGFRCFLPVVREIAGIVLFALRLSAFRGYLPLFLLVHCREAALIPFLCHSFVVRLLIAIHDVHVPTVVLFWSCTTCTNCTSEGLGYLSRDRRAMPCRPWMLSFSVSRHPLLRSLVCSRCELISKLLPYACMFHLDAELFYVALATNIDHGLPPLIQERQ